MCNKCNGCCGEFDCDDCETLIPECYDCELDKECDCVKRKLRLEKSNREFKELGGDY